MATPRLQFSVGGLLLITTVVAAVLGGAAALDVPFSHPIVQGLLVVYLVVFGVLAVVCGPRVIHELKDLRRRRRELDGKRAALAEKVRQAKLRKPPQS